MLFPQVNFRIEPRHHLRTRLHVLTRSLRQEYLIRVNMVQVKHLDMVEAVELYRLIL